MIPLKQSWTVEEYFGKPVQAQVPADSSTHPKTEWTPEEYFGTAQAEQSQEQPAERWWPIEKITDVGAAVADAYEGAQEYVRGKLGVEKLPDWIDNPSMAQGAEQSMRQPVPEDHWALAEGARQAAAGLANTPATLSPLLTGWFVDPKTTELYKQGLKTQEAISDRQTRDAQMDDGWLHDRLTGVARSTGQMLPYMVAPGGAPAKVVGMIGQGMTGEAADARQRAIELGLPEEEVRRYMVSNALAEGLPPAIFSMVGLGGAEKFASGIPKELMTMLGKGGDDALAAARTIFANRGKSAFKEAAKVLGRGVAEELPEENLTSIWQTLEGATVDPKNAPKNAQDWLKILADTSAEVFLQTVMMGGPAAVNRARATHETALAVGGSIPDQAAPTPTPPQETQPASEQPIPSIPIDEMPQDTPVGVTLSRGISPRIPQATEAQEQAEPEPENIARFRKKGWGVQRVDIQGEQGWDVDINGNHILIRGVSDRFGEQSPKNFVQSVAVEQTEAHPEIAQAAQAALASNDTATIEAVRQQAVAAGIRGTGGAITFQSGGETNVLGIMELLNPNRETSTNFHETAHFVRRFFLNKRESKIVERDSRFQDEDGTFNEELFANAAAGVASRQKAIQKGLEKATGVERVLYDYTQRVGDFLGAMTGKSFDQLVREMNSGKLMERGVQTTPEQQKAQGALAPGKAPEIRPLTGQSTQTQQAPAQQTAVPEPVTQEVTPKQPWEMTPEEYVGGVTDVDKIAIAKSAHANHVKQAVKEGRDVPISVLEKYKNNGWAQKAIDASSGSQMAESERQTDLSSTSEPQRPIEPGGWNDYDSMGRDKIVAQAKERGVRTNRKTQDIIDELRSMNERGVGAVEVIKDMDENLQAFKDEMRRSGIRMNKDHRDKDDLKWGKEGPKNEDLGPLNRRGLPQGMRRYIRQSGAFTPDTAITEASLYGLLPRDAEDAALFDLLRRPHGLTKTREYSLEEYLSSKKEPETVSGLQGRNIPDTERNAIAPEDEEIPFSTLDPDLVAERDMLLQRAGGDQDRAWKMYERMVAAAANRDEPVDLRKADAMRRALLGDQEQGDLFGEAAPAKERREFKKPVDRPVQQSLEGLDEGTLFSTAPETGLTFREELTGAYSGQKDLVLTAYREGRPVGYVKYSEYQGEPKVQMLEVDPENRRQGVATALVEQLKKDYPDFSRENLGMLTEDGSAFANARFSTAQDREPIQGVAYTAMTPESRAVGRVVRHFGTTRDPKEAGYVTPDGRMLDLSGKRQGGTGGVRYMDHRELPDLGGKDQTEDMLAAKNAGLVRVDFNLELEKAGLFGPGDVKYSTVKDEGLINRLESGEKVKAFRAMQVIDGKLYPPMSAKVNGVLREPTEIGKWEQAEEQPELANNGYFKLDKGNKKSVDARYNPYFHVSTSPLNDQFAEAHKRDNLVTVEVEVPKSELTSGYKAEGAKDAVGEVTWNSGPVSSKLPSEKKRKVILSRYAKVVRIVPDSEVADVIAKTLDGENITIPDARVTPSLKQELVKRGVAVESTRYSTSNPEKERVAKEAMEGAKDYLDNLEDAYNGKLDPRRMLLIGNTPKVLQRLGAGKLQFYINAGKIAKIRHEHPEITLDILRKIPEELHVPVAVMRSSSRSTNPNGFVVLTSIQDENTKPVIAAVHVDVFKVDRDINEVASIYGKRDAETLNGLKYLYLDTERAPGVSLSIGLQLPVEETLQEPKVSILHDSDIFKSNSTKFSTAESHPSPIGLPELDRMVVDMLGSHPEIRRKMGNKRGLFQPTATVGTITLKADIFIGPDVHHAYSPKKPTEEQISQHKETMAKEYGVSSDDLVIRTSRQGNGYVTATYIRDHSYAGRTLAHEIGHADDWLPEKDLERGNLLGRIAKLSHYLKGTLAPSGNPEDALTARDRAIIRKRARDLTSKDFNYKEDPEGFNARVQYLYAQFVQEEIEQRGLCHEKDTGMEGTAEMGGGMVTPGIRTELVNLSRWWRGPFDPQGKASYDRYRNSGKELYADAISVLLNAPDVLAEKAPQFDDALRNFFDKHEPMSDLYKQIQEELSQGLTPEKRLARDRAMMGRDSAVRDKAILARQADEHPTTPREIWKSLVYNLADTTTHLPTQEARLAVKDVAYVGAKLTQFQRDVKARVADVLLDAGASYDDFGVYLMRRRAAGERQDLANPGLVRGEDAKELLDTLRKDIGEDKYAAIEKAAKALTGIRNRHIIPQLRRSGLFSEELLAKIENNDEYATFDVVDYFEKNHGGETGAMIRRQIGTAKDILNPFYQTVHKDTALLFAAHVNTAKQTMVDQMRQFDQQGIREPEYKWNGRTREPQEPADRKNWGLVTYMADGVQKGVIVRREIADLFKHEPENANIIFDAANAATSVLKSIFTANNPLFSLWNIQRDFRSTLANIPAKGLTGEVGLAPQLALSYLKTAKDAFLHAFRKESTPLMRELLEGGLLIADRQWTAKDLTQVEEYERLVREFDLNPDSVGPFWKRASKAVFHDFNQMVEVWTKAAGYEYMQRKGLTSAYDMRDIMRGIVGSPDFLTRGKMTRWTNMIFLYSNAGIQGYEASWRAAKAQPMKYLLRRVAYTIIPSAIMAYLAFGDDDDEEIKDYRDAMRAIPEYEKRRMITLPVSWDGQKVSWIPLPQDHIGEMIHSTIWNLFSSDDAASKRILNTVLGGIPMEPGSINPWLQLGRAAFQYAIGQNPYDSFRGRPSIDDQIWQAGGFRTAVEFAKWSWNQTGGSTFGNFERPFQVRESGAAGLPIIKPAMRRFLRTAEKQDAPEPVDAERAKTVVSAKDFAAEHIRNAAEEKDANPYRAYREWKKTATDIPKGYDVADFKRVYQNLKEKRWPKQDR